MDIEKIKNARSKIEAEALTKHRISETVLKKLLNDLLSLKITLKKVLINSRIQ